MYRVTLIVVLPLLISAGPGSLVDRVRVGNDAVRAGNLELAERHFRIAAERTTDPGLVAFNRAVIAFAKRDFREAELGYLRVLEDRDAPPPRRLRATFDRGVCLIHRGNDVAGLRVAIACFEAALDSNPVDETFRADAQYNLELAKILWNIARAKRPTPPTPNEHEEPPESEPQPSPRESQAATETTTTTQANDNPSVKPNASTSPQTGDAKPKSSNQQNPGNGTLPVLVDSDDAQPMSPEDTHLHLEQIRERLIRERKQNAQMRAGPERPNVRDW